jgi:lipoprotein-releasing system permease protein
VRFEWIVALRFLREGGLQTMLIITGTALGISFIVFITAILTNLQRDIVERTLGVQPHITIRPQDEVARPQWRAAGEPGAQPEVQARAQRLRSIDQWQPIARALDADPQVRAVSPIVSGPATVTRGDAARVVTLVGIVPDRYTSVTQLGTRIVAGSLTLAPGDTVIGRELAQDLGARVGDMVRIATPVSSGDAYRVRGIYDLGAKAFNRSYAYVALPVGQALHALPGGVSSIDLKVDNLWTAEAVALRLQREVPHQVESWMQANAQLMIGLANQTLMTRLIRITIGLVVAIGIASVLIVAVVQKTREIGILRAMGASRGRVLRVFLLQGALIGFVGAALGSIGGYWLTRMMAGLLRSADGARLITAHLDLPLYGATLLGAAVVGLLAAVAPARRAARLDPATAIRL